MSRRDNFIIRCARCRMLGPLCICEILPRLETQTRLVLFIHRSEARKTTNTGQLATECLVNSEVVVRGHAMEHEPAFALDPNRQALLLFPSEDATPLDTLTDRSRPVTLIVPDGTWRQATKVRQRVPGLAEVPCVTLPNSGPTNYRLRSETRDGGLATMEAIARAFGILEGAEVQAKLDHVFRVMVERTLWSRGALDAAQVTGGVSEKARVWLRGAAVTRFQPS